MMGGSRVVRFAIAVITIAVVASCGGSDDDGGEGASSSASSASKSSTTVTVATATTLVSRTEVGVPAPPDAVVLSMLDWKFAPTTLRVPAGTLKVALKNDERTCSESTCVAADWVHDVSILDPETGLSMARSERLDAGASGLFVVEGLQPGSYRMICTIHALVSMNATLEVTA